MENVSNAWGKIFSHNELLPKDKFVVVGGNEECGTAYTREELIANWRSELRHARNQDISVYFNGKLIRSVRNFDATILGRSTPRSSFVKTEYVKHAM